MSQRAILLNSVCGCFFFSFNLIRGLVKQSRVVTCPDVIYTHIQTCTLSYALQTCMLSRYGGHYSQKEAKGNVYHDATPTILCCGDGVFREMSSVFFLSKNRALCQVSLLVSSLQRTFFPHICSCI